MPDHWIFVRDGNNENVPPERWRWEVQYTDGTVLQQFDDRGIFHQIREIDLDKLKVFGMVHATQPPVMLYWRPGMTLIHFYLNIVEAELNQAGERIGKPPTMIRLYCFGYEYQGQKIILVILPDNGVIVTDDVDTIDGRG